jgi:amino acid transporter
VPSNEASTSIIGMACVCLVVIVVMIMTVWTSDNQMNANIANGMNNSSPYYNNTVTTGTTLNLSSYLVWIAVILGAALCIIAVLLTMIGGRGL